MLSSPVARAHPKTHLPALDGARGLAVLFVLLDHASDAGFLPDWLSFNRAGGYGVLLFFSLSAFLLTFLLFAEDGVALASPRTWLSYWLRRFVRIYPLFAVTLVAWAFDERHFGAREVLNHLLLRDGQNHFWTIAVEFKFYFLLPLLVLIPSVLWKWNRIVATVALLGLAAFLRFGLRPLEEAYSVTNDVWLEEYLEVFLLGAVAGWAFAKYGSVVAEAVKASGWLRWLLEACAWSCLVAAILRVPSIYNVVLNAGPDVKRLGNAGDFFSITWPLFLLSTLLGAGYLRAVLSTVPLRVLGWISYSLYLWHPFLTPWVEDLNFSRGTSLLIYLLASLSVAGLSHVLIERPLARVRLRKSPRGTAA